MSFRKTAILAIAALTAACSSPMSQSTNPAPLQPAAVSNGRVNPDVMCNFLKMEPRVKRVMVHEEVAITPILRTRSMGGLPLLLASSAVEYQWWQPLHP